MYIKPLTCPLTYLHLVYCTLLTATAAIILHVPQAMYSGPDSLFLEIRCDVTVCKANIAE